jgi:ABC-type nitrate/sulfonate/bicarbonate transport system substrate-binding protein
MAAGSIEMSLVHIIGVVRAASSGVPVVAVASTGQMEDWAMWVQAGSPFKNLKEMRGKKIGISRFGGTGDANTKVVFKTLGIEKDIKIIAVGGLRSRIAALKTGAIDGFLVSRTSMVELELKGEVRGIGSLLAYLPQPWETETVNAHKNLIAKRPEVVKSVVRAILQGGDLMRRDKAWSLDKLKTALKFSERSAPAIFKIIVDSHRSTDGRIDPKAVANVRNFLIDYGLLAKDKALEVRDLYTDAFVPGR